MSKSKKKKHLTFGKALIIYVCALAVIIAGVLIYLWTSLAKYQKGIDEKKANSEYEETLRQAPQNCFMNYVENLTVSDWTDLWYEAHPEHFDAQNIVEDTMNKYFVNGDVSYYKSDDSTDTAPRYLINNNEDTLAIMTLSGSGTDYQVSNTEFLIEGDYASTVIAPKGARVYINDYPLDESYVEDSQTDVPMKEYANEVVNPIIYDTYVIKGLLSEPAIRVEGERELSKDSDGTYKYILSGTEANSIVDKADSFIKSLLHYYWVGKVDAETNMNAALSKVASGSEASRLIRISLDGIIWRPSFPGVTCDIENSPVYVLADNCYCVDVSYTPYNTDNSDIEAGAYRVFFLNTGRGLGIYNFELR